MDRWGVAPWENDEAAKWFGEFFSRTKLADHVRRTLRITDPEGYWDEVRGVACVVILLGHTNVWPKEHIDSDLEFAASKLDKVLSVFEEMKEDGGEEVDDFIILVQREIQELRSRIKGSDIAPPTDENGRKLWGFWE